MYGILRLQGGKLVTHDDRVKVVGHTYVSAEKLLREPSCETSGEIIYIELNVHGCISSATLFRELS